MEELNIVELIEKNPISKLSSEYNNKLLNKIKEKFSEFEQQLFVSSFYCYLNYDKNIDFVIDLDNVWKWIGFTLKATAKDLLEKYFDINIDYKILVRSKPEQDLPENSDKKWGGQNKQIIMLTIKCFKSLCLKARTKKADEIHDYYMKMEEVLQETISEETDELRLQLEKEKENSLNIKLIGEEEKIELIKQKKIEIEKAIISQFPVNTECVYIGTIENISDKQEKLIKFGSTNNLHQRVLNHKKDYNNFILIEAFRVQNKAEIENLIRSHNKIKKQIRTIFSNEKNRTEIIAYDDSNFTIEQLKKSIKDIIHAKTYCIENYNKILKENEEFEKENNELKEKFEERLNILKEQYEFKIINLESELEEQKKLNNQQAIQIQEMQEKIDKQKDIVEIIKNEQELIYQNPLIPEDELTNKFHEFINKMCIVRPDVEEHSTVLEGQFRIWLGTKPRKEIFHSLKNYLDIRFKPTRISFNNQLVHGYIGIKLKSIDYKKKYQSNQVENFIFHACKFSPCGKINYSTLNCEYQKWKASLGLQCSDDDIKEIKKYLNECEHVIRATVWTEEGSNEGYYGIMLKSEDVKPKNSASTTGKKVYKIENSSGNVLGNWNSIADAAQYECISKAKMSRSVKAKTLFNDDYYYSAVCPEVKVISIEE